MESLHGLHRGALATDAVAVVLVRIWQWVAARAQGRKIDNPVVVASGVH